MASCCLYQGKLAESEEILKESWPSVSSSESAFRKMLWYRTSADLERWRGRLGRSQAIVEQAFRLLDRENLGDTSLKLYLYQPLAWVHYLRNELDKAPEYATMSCRNAEQVSHISEIIGARFLLSLLSCARGERDKALLHSERLECAVSRSIPGSLKLAGAYIALASALTGNIEAAEKWVATLGPQSTRAFFYRIHLPMPRPSEASPDAGKVHGLLRPPRTATERVRGPRHDPRNGADGRATRRGSPYVGATQARENSTQRGRGLCRKGGVYRSLRGVQNPRRAPPRRRYPRSSLSPRPASSSCRPLSVRRRGCADDV